VTCRTLKHGSPEVVNDEFGISSPRALYMGGTAYEPIQFGRTEPKTGLQDVPESHILPITEAGCSKAICGTFSGGAVPRV
jgi:hypothetical protein